MITKFVLIIWIGQVHSQSLTTMTFNTLAECGAVKHAVAMSDSQFNYLPDWPRCVEYTFEAE